MADLLYHAMVLLKLKDVKMEEVLELRPKKAARPRHVRLCLSSFHSCLNSWSRGLSCSSSSHLCLRLPSLRSETATATAPQALRRHAIIAAPEQNASARATK
ncbi:hypothetical protein B296_00044825 [Ensete ventricosum]|uniref:Phosphoribosyl-ATP diphosphatase n=1 Tax=Ensete ventricosum TaxID=4639 RepID=A0A426XYF1_ENSVE|nr:hypothetical protein B296_00044825 [Ensete ventricosum]